MSGDSLAIKLDLFLPWGPNKLVGALFLCIVALCIALLAVQGSCGEPWNKRPMADGPNQL